MTTENQQKLRVAARKGQLDGDGGVKFLVGEMLKYGSPEDLDWADSKPLFRCAIWEATWKNHEAIVRYLLEKGANPDVADINKRTPLHEAAYYGHDNLVELLLEKKAKIDAKDMDGMTPLCRSVCGDQDSTVKLLIDKGALANDLAEDGTTVAHLAAFRGKTELSWWLFYKGAWKNRFSKPLEKVPVPQAATDNTTNAVDAKAAAPTEANVAPAAPNPADSKNFESNKSDPKPQL